MKVGIISNPVSGGRFGRARGREISAALAAHFSDCVFRQTASAGDATRLAIELVEAGCELIIALGGDGTIGDVVDGLMRSARPETPFSFAPTGTGCDFARNFALPHDPEAVARQIVDAPVRRIDVARMRGRTTDGRIVERHFANIASVGVSGRIVQAVNGRGRRVASGSLRFLLCSVREILRYRSQGVRLVVDGVEVFKGPVTVVAVANGAWFGGGMHVVPFADLGDGLLDIGVLHGASRTGVLGILARLYSAAHVGHRLISFFRGRVIDIEPLGDQRLSIEADGETLPFDSLHVEVLPGALSLKI
ncbi:MULTISPECIES: diacylglycerol/lipid kinase family protein [Alphaproteobacteria]|uniref:diacylglycerol/lipid kinase family protein n=1 Tax=Alphaproteobacteria TaxID=28211 RepID=UPI0014795A28|nr:MULTISPECIES: diacylglycerol kinase family protein [Alphaproteobacteria]